jgi:hypothetical protein
MVEESQAPRPEGDELPPPAVEYWPRREDTREFQAVSVADDEAEAEAPQLPPVAEVEEDQALPGRDFAWG